MASYAPTGRSVPGDHRGASGCLPVVGAAWPVFVLAWSEFAWFSLLGMNAAFCGVLRNRTVCVLVVYLRSIHVTGIFDDRTKQAVP